MERARELERPALNRRMRLLLRGGAALLLGAACQRPRPPAPVLPLPASQADGCALSNDSVVHDVPLTVAISGAVDPAHVPVPETDAERMVFRQAYETLVRLDCNGAARPGLASSWSSTDDGARWTFTLRAGAQFWDFQPVTARDVIASWSARDTTLLSGMVLEAPDDHTLVVRLAAGSPMFPRRLADPALSVTRLSPRRVWPDGTSDYVPDTTEGVGIVPYDARRGIGLRRLGANDARDWIDRGVDLVITDDQAALSYAAGRSDLVSVPLPWDRTYVLLVVGRAPEVSDAERASLARDVLHVDARAASGPYWWEALPACPGPPLSSPSAPLPSSRPLLIYARGDPAARDLAERIVALQSNSLRAAGVSDSGFDAALARGDAAEYVLALPRTSLDPCRDVRRFVARVPWLPSGVTLEPLVDARHHAIVRRTAAAAFTVDWDGVVVRVR